ncbi:hypothetical protein Tam1G_1159 [Bifidobacterium imperatoris]|uniref:DUF4839 domain-containing protein n=1 Tax=Bifidobacterium imperatoris TaxID=2020965 RepID=A0A2N5ISB0_9BIFI|nr:hypothetical protein Tam1G_1159 [Bifidobacterium imperatoris]
MTMSDTQNGAAPTVPNGRVLMTFSFENDGQHVYDAMRNMLSFSAEFMMKSCDDASRSITCAAYDGGCDLTAVVSNEGNRSTVTLYAADPDDGLVHKHAERFHNDLMAQLQVNSPTWAGPTPQRFASASVPVQTAQGRSGKMNGTTGARSKPGFGTMIVAWFAGLDRKGRTTLAWIAAGVLFVLILIGVVSCGIASEHAPLPEGMSRMPESAATFEGQNYEDVVTQLKNAGFTNIETKAQEDLITGWMTKEGEVDKVSVAGETDFSASEQFKSDVKIVVTYHAFPSDSSSGDNTSSDTSSGSEESSPSTGTDTTQTENPSETDTQSSESAESAGMTEQNNPEFAALLAGPDMGSSVSAFATKYANHVIEYDGYVASVAPHGNYKTRFDYLILAGDDDASAHGPNFQFADVNYSDLHLSANAPDTFGLGLKVHVKAKVKSYDSSTGLFQLESVAISMR